MKYGQNSVNSRENFITVTVPLKLKIRIAQFVENTGGFQFKPYKLSHEIQLVLLSQLLNAGEFYNRKEALSNIS